MPFSKLPTTCAAIICSILLSASPLGAIGIDHPACAAPVTARPAGCPPLPDIATLSLEVRQSHVFFPGGGVVLDAQARKQLLALAQLLEDPIMDQTCLKLIGHTDPSGPDDINTHLSYLRAAAVADFLASELERDRTAFDVTGVGETNLLANVPKDSLAHRRVAIHARPCGGNVS